MADLLTPTEAAATIGVSDETLRRWRAEGTGPEYEQVRIGMRTVPRYQREVLRQWKRNQNRESK